MRVLRYNPGTRLERPIAMALGNFDGVHRGHQALIDAAIKQAMEQNLQATVAFFYPHPKTFFGTPVPLLTPLAMRLKRLKALGVSQVIIFPFDQSMAAQSPTQFMRILSDALRVQWLTVGDDFRFGHRRQGDVATLQNYGGALALTPTQYHQGQRISSTWCRACVQHAQWATLTALLGQPFVWPVYQRQGQWVAHPESIHPPSGVHTFHHAQGHFKARVEAGILRHVPNAFENQGWWALHLGEVFDS